MESGDEGLLKLQKESKKGRRLHIAKLIVKPRLVMVVYYTLVQQYTSKFDVEVLKAPKVVCFYCFYFGVNPAYVLFGGQFFQKVTHSGLFEAVFDEIHPIPGKACNKDCPRRYQQEYRCYRRKNADKIVQHIPSGHICHPYPSFINVGRL
ncbi:MAG: hypothetical protein LBG27_06560 [Spirochaetaceae bacterium]|jgi:hypothetical protein|nr:hypothetical protein [Spirochaetaceae bacterium]